MLSVEAHDFAITCCTFSLKCSQSRARPGRRQIRKAHPSPLAALRAYGPCLSGLATSPQALARNQSYLQIDLTDSDLRQHLVSRRGPRAWNYRH